MNKIKYGQSGGLEGSGKVAVKVYQCLQAPAAIDATTRGLPYLCCVRNSFHFRCLWYVGVRARHAQQHV